MSVADMDINLQIATQFFIIKATLLIMVSHNSTDESLAYMFERGVNTHQAHTSGTEGCPLIRRNQISYPLGVTTDKDTLPLSGIHFKTATFPSTKPEELLSHFWPSALKLHTSWGTDTVDLVPKYFKARGHVVLSKVNGILNTFTIVRRLRL